MALSEALIAAALYAVVPLVACAVLRRRGAGGPAVQRWARRLVPLAVTWLGALLVAVLVSVLTTIRMKGDAWLLACAGAAAVCVPLSLLPVRWRRFASAALVALLGLLGYADTITLRGLDTLPSLVTFSGGTNLWSIRDSIAGLSRPADLAFLAYLPAALAILAWPGPAAGSTQWRHELRAGVAVTLLLSAAAWPLASATTTFLDGKRSWKVFRITAWVHRGVLTAHAFDSARVIRERAQSKALGPQERADIDAYFAQRAREERGARGPDFGLARDLNVLFLQVEAVQQWVMEARFRGKPVMPFLDSLKKRSQYFTRIYDQTGPAPTSNCEYATMCSQQPLPVGAVSFRRPDNHFVSLPRLLRSKGYTTVSAHGYKRGYWNRSRFHPSLGFDHSYFRRSLGSSRRMGWGMADEVFLERGLARVAKLDQPLFGMLITLTSHHPYNYVPRKQRTLRRVYGLGMLGNYLHSMRYVDQSLQHFFELLDASPLAGKTLVVLYGDHDSKLRFDERIQKRAKRTLSSLGEGVGMAQLGERHWSVDRIPLLFVWPGARRTGEIDTVGGQVDIAPTLLHYLGIERPRAFLGRALLPGRGGQVVRMDGSAADAKHVYTQRDKVPCRDHARRALPEQACAELAKDAARELEMSWAVTLRDLQHEL